MLKGEAQVVSRKSELVENKKQCQTKSVGRKAQGAEIKKPPEEKKISPMEASRKDLPETFLHNILQKVKG
jgi:hypothetical protein